MKLAKTYNPQAYEPQTYLLWEQSRSFTPKRNLNKGKFSIALPPPNANGNLHIGHALAIAVEDSMVRYHRLKGESTVFVPGADHAGFETWVVFERNLEKKGESRFDYSRESLYRMTWDFVAEQRGNMEIQLRELGASVDWDELVFTLDKKVIERSYKTFKKLWDDGLVYRGEKIVNFCTKHQTSFADIEVVHKTEKSKLWFIAYTLADSKGEITVATTRPETMLGDVALAVNPFDARFKKLIGKSAWVPLVKRKIPIIADLAVDSKFGTGVVKVTPAHDLVDFEIGERHKLPIIHLIAPDGTLTKEAPTPYAGMDSLAARKKIIQALQESGQLLKAQDYSHSVGHCYKCDTVIQPLLKEQWFLKTQPLAKRAIKAIQNREITFTPANKAKVLINYYKKLKDWNLSRQISWGIPIPAFQNSKDPTKWIFDERVHLKTIQLNGATYKREEDTFDTWFSSGQWPFIVTDYLENGKLKDFYPLDVMETGQDLVFPWVSRMIMLGLFATNKVPFKHVYFHGLVLDEHGQKMSKSKGNVINPQDIIKEYGSDAMRMGILANRSPGINQAFSLNSVKAGRNFCNKLWNIARFAEDLLGDNYHDRVPKPQSVADHWIISRLNRASQKIGDLLENYRFAEAYELMYHTIWDEVADWYIEVSKITTTPSVMAYVLETCLKLAHPFAPFVTEIIWQTLAWEKGLLINSQWPTKVNFSKTEAKKFNEVQAVTEEIRFITASLASGKQQLLYLDDPLIASQSKTIKKLAGLESIRKVEKGSGLRLAVAKHEVWLNINEVTLKKHRHQLEQRLNLIREQIQRLEGRLSNKNYTDKAPALIVNQTKQQLSEQKIIEQRLLSELNLVK